VFGASPQAQEVFIAWAFARYTEHVAAAGKAAYRLPMFVNAALIRPGRAPGEYPSGGPLPHLFDVWRAGAPSIDFLAPDVYFPNFAEWVRRYDRPGEAMFIPEAGRAGAAEAPANALYAIGAHDALGFSPFSIESITEPQSEPLGRAYALLAELAPLILAHQGRGTIAGVRAPVAYDGAVEETPQRVALGDFALTVSFVDPWVPRAQQDIAAHGGLIIALARNEFLIAGAGLTITFAPLGPGDPIAGIESAWEGRFIDGEWRPGRLLNGDQTHQGRHVRLPPGELTVQRVRLYRYR
jgi:beta-galactosidase GanA